MSKKLITSFLIAIAALIGIYVIGKFLFMFYFGMNYMDEKNPQYLQYVHERINVGTPQLKTEQQCDTLLVRIDEFLTDSIQYQVPDSILLIRNITIGGSQKEVLIYFDVDPVEIYRVTFDCTGFSYIDDVYQSSSRFREISTTTLDTTEQARIEQRLRKEIIDKINWSFY